MVWFLLGCISLLAGGAMSAPLWCSKQAQTRILGILLWILLPVLSAMGYWASKDVVTIEHWLTAQSELNPLVDQMIAGEAFDHQQLNHLKMDDFVMVLQHRLHQKSTVNGWLLLANIYEKLNASDQAEMAYRNAQQLAPDQLEPALALLAFHFKIKQGQLDASDQALIENALKHFPRSRQLLVLYAMTAYHHGQYAQAIAVWQKLLRMTDPHNTASIQVLTRSITNAQRQLSPPVE